MGQSKKLMLNEKAALGLGFESAEAAVGQSILWGDPYEILAVVKDYHHMSLKEEIKPMVFLPSQASGYFSYGGQQQPNEGQPGIYRGDL
jgi:putative ABC transport system permease protein